MSITSRVYFSDSSRFKKLPNQKRLSKQEFDALLESQRVKRHEKRGRRAEFKAKLKADRESQPKKKWLPVDSSPSGPWWKKYSAYLKSEAWRELRAKVIADRGFRCESCGNYGQVQAHHLTYERVGHERIEDLKVLCKPCHEASHRRRF